MRQSQSDLHLGVVDNLDGVFPGVGGAQGNERRTHDK